MKKNFDNFDDLMKDKLDGMEFPFNEANWEKASQMIDAARPAKKPFGNLLLVSSIIVTCALIISSVYYFGGKLGNTTSPEVAQKNEQSSVSTSNELIANSVAATSQQLNNSFEKTTPNSNENASTNVNSNNNTNTINNSASINTSETKNSADVHVKSNSRPTNMNVAVVSSNTKNNFGKKNNSNPIISKTSSSNGMPVGAAEGARQKEQQNGNASATNNGSTDSQNTFATNEPKKESLTDPESSVVNQNVEVAQTTATNTAAPDTSNGTNSSFTKKKDYVRTKHHTVLVEAGAINSFGWAVNNVRNGNNIAPFAGINYMYNFDSRSSVLFGLQYNTLSNLSESKVSFSVTSYEFGMKNDVTTYKITNLHYATIPMKYIHKLNSNHSFGIGLNASYLLSIQNQIESTKHIESNINETTVKKDVGYGYDQLSRFNAQFALSYQYQISKKIGFNAELNQNLTNVVKDYQFFGVESKSSRPAAVKLSLTYTLLNK
ncbi:MAG: hypothetical protein ACK50A_03715 [Sphingobacteriaceae bacterium]